MSAPVPFFSQFGPLQLMLRTARALGLGGRALNIVVRRIGSKGRKPKVFAGYEPTEHDVFATCFPKSGTNWAMQLIVQTAHYGQAEFNHIHDLAPWPDGAVFPGIAALDDAETWRCAPSELRAIKTALETAYVPYSPKARYLCVARDPKEIYVSAYYFLTGVFGMREHISPDAWFELSMKPDSLMSNWPEHMASYWAWRARPNVLILFYREMKRDLPGTVDKIAALLDVTLSEEQRAEVVRRCDFAYMKAHEHRFAPPRLPLLTGKRRGQLIRSGKAGKSSELLSAEQRAQVDARVLGALRQRGSDFPYEELFLERPATPPV